MANPFQVRPGLSIEPRHMALAQSFMGRTMPPNIRMPGTVGGGPNATTGPVSTKSKLPLGPNMMSFVQSPQGAALMQRLLGTIQRQPPIRGQQVNPVGLA